MSEKGILYRDKEGKLYAELNEKYERNLDGRI